MSDEGGDWPEWATKVLIGAAAIAAGAIGAGIIIAGLTSAAVTVATSAAVASLKIAGTSAAIGAGMGAIEHRVSTGSWKGVGNAALNSAVDGFMWGGITAGTTNIALATKGTYINRIGRLKPDNKQGNGYMGVRYGKRKNKGFSYKSIELHSPHKRGAHQEWHWQKSNWSYHDKVWKVSTKKSKHWTIFGRRM